MGLIEPAKCNLDCYNTENIPCRSIVRFEESLQSTFAKSNVKQRAALLRRAALSARGTSECS